MDAPKGEPDDFECPPSGKLIHAHYTNGDELRIEFRELLSREEAKKHYPVWKDSYQVDFPVTAVEVCNRVGGTDISFDKDSTTISGMALTGCFSKRSRYAILFTIPLPGFE